MLSEIVNEFTFTVPLYDQFWKVLPCELPLRTIHQRVFYMQYVDRPVAFCGLMIWLCHLDYYLAS